MITFVVLLLGVIAFYGKSQIENELFFVNKRSLKQIGLGTSLKLAEYNHLSSKIANDSQIIDMLSQNEDVRNGDAVEKATQEILDSYAWTYSEYNALVYTYVMSKEGTLYPSAYSRDTAMELILEYFDFDDFLAKPDVFYYQPTIENKKEKGVTRYSFFLIRKIKDHITEEVYGYVILNISEKNLYDTYKDLIDTGKNFYITAPDGMIISEKDKQRIGTFCGVKISQIIASGHEDKLVLWDDRGKESYFLYYEIPQTGWYLVETIETSGLLVSLGKFNLLIVGTTAVVIIVLLFILNFFLKAISEPVMAVKERMTELGQGDLRTGGEVKEPTAEQLKNREDIKTAAFAESDYDTTGWENVVLPHTWNAVDGANGWKEEKTERNDFDGGGVAYYRGVGVYRKNVEFGGEYSGKKIYIDFGGAFQITDLYINGEWIGNHEGGFGAFRFDITKYIKIGEDNLIAVKVDNSPTNYIAPVGNEGDYTKMGGLYRDVSLIVTDEVHIDALDYASCGIYLTPRNIDINKKTANIFVASNIVNDSDTDSEVDVKVTLLGNDENKIAVVKKAYTVSAGKNLDICCRLD